MTLAPTRFRRLFFGRTLHKFPQDCACPEYACLHKREVAPVAEADVVSSILEPDLQNDPLAGELHAPVIDIDLPCQLVPSSTPGHHHLYIDVAVPWDRYVAVLEAMAAAGIVQPGYVEACKSRGFTSVRLPWKHKELPAPTATEAPF